MRDRQQVDDAVSRAIGVFGRIDVLINNAGVMHVAPFARAQDEDFRESIDTHFWVRCSLHARACGRCCNVVVRGQHRKEALWFALGPSTPISSIDADPAARMVVDAVRARRAVVAPGWQSRAAELVYHVAPEAAAVVGGWLAEFVMPADAPRPGGNRARRSRDLDLDLDLAPLAGFFPTRDAERFNQPIAEDERDRNCQRIHAAVRSPA